MYSMCMNNYSSRNFNMNMLYIDGHPRTHGKIVGFINSYRSSLFSANCSFEDHSIDKELFMKMKASKFVVVHAIHIFSPSNEFLINYNFRRPPNSHQKHLSLGLPLYIPLGHKKNMIK